MNPQYSSIEDGDNAELTPVLANGGFERPSRKTTSAGFFVLLGGVLAGALLMVVAFPSFSRTPIEGGPYPIEGSPISSTRACDFEECYNNDCNHESAPFICLFHNGGPHMGCSPVDWTPESCDDSCDLSACDDMVIPDDTDSCEGVVCETEWCNGAQICPTDVPYQCVDGSARFGCSGDKLHW
eukprot:CAMPEP_0198137420 /NCGR_PEP_ID=MMETSP1443-20131203/898_1 /TAXON_ID=186043 /ORGANISM="Entomoneis sp., Strain CCMP2396" /LENGTH=182 /DNA_ID=CAMNT_0043798827 /DNA_START=83 /DNA_END=628 /DNA_ORIENTATION=+